MAGVYGSSLPPGSTCFRAPLTKGAEAFVVKPKKRKLVTAQNIWCVSNKPYRHHSQQPHMDNFIYTKRTPHLLYTI